MSEYHQKDKPGFGRGRFVLGHGTEGVFGHVALYVQVVPEPGFCSLHWRVEGYDLANDVRKLVEHATEEYLRQYIAWHTAFGLRVTIVEVVSDDIRKNDYKRAVNLAFRSALEDIGLPIPQIFSPQ